MENLTMREARVIYPTDHECTKEDFVSEIGVIWAGCDSRSAQDYREARAQYVLERRAIMRSMRIPTSAESRN